MELLAKLLTIKNIYRKSILIFIDMFLIYLSIKLTYAISDINTISTESVNNELINISILITSLISILFYIFTGQYKGITRYIGSRSVYTNSLRNIIITIFINLYFLIFFDIRVKILDFITLWFLISSLCSSYRFVLRDVIFLVKKKVSKFSKSIVIYGAGTKGAQLLSSLKLSEQYKVVLFIDDNVNLQGRHLNGIKIVSPNCINKYNGKIFGIFLAIPKLKRKQLISTINNFQNLGIKTFEIPEAEYLSDELLNIKKLKPIDIEDLLYRNSVPPDEKLLKKCIRNKIICVTGAGGSIGSELCRQIIKYKPLRLVLFEMSEHNLYQIDKELSNQSQHEIIPILGDCSNIIFVKGILEKYSVNIVIHAAAYKHVPLVELNPFTGIANNIFSTKVLCQIAYELNLEKLILISSDKAVRPTNIMGASKRVSEIIVQAYAEEIKLRENKNTKFSMVRFGNVLDSSGSVVPLFKNQIKQGGPLTLTDNNIERYFMTIKEAAQLVLQAAELSEGGELFLLDMGVPIKIRELAEQMIKLSGLSVKNNNNPDGDIEIKITGLRPGEKLYEELLIDAKSEKTSNPLIFKAKEKMIPLGQVLEKINLIEEYLQDSNIKKLFKVLKYLVPEWYQSNN